FTQLGLTRLEDRVVLTASAGLNAGVLELMLDAQDDVAEVTVGGGNEVLINGATVSGGGGVVLTSDVNRLTAIDSSAGMNETGQEVRISDSLTLSDGLSIDSTIETTTVNAAIDGGATDSFNIQSAAIGLGADLTTAGQDITLGGNVAVADGLTLTLTTGAGAGTIQITGSLDGTAGTSAESLTLTAGTGNVTLNAVGSAGSDDLESLTVTSATSATISGAVDVNSSLTITAGTASLNDDVSSGNLQIITTANTTVTGTVNSSGTIDLDAATFTPNGAITAQDSVTIDVANPLVLNQNLTSGGATTITVTADDNGAVPFTLSSGVTLSSASGMLTIQADDMNLSGTVAAAGQTVLLRQNSDGEVIELGGTGITDNELELAVAEIDSVTASILRIGHIAAGNINLTQEVSPANSATLSLLSGGSVADIVAGGIGATDLAIQATGTVTLDNVRNVEALAASVTGAGSSFVFGNEDDGFVIGSNVDGLTGIMTADNTAGSTGSITLTTTTGSIEIAQTLMTGNASGAATVSSGSISIFARGGGTIFGTGFVQTGSATGNDAGAGTATSGNITLTGQEISVDGAGTESGAFLLGIGNASGSNTNSDGTLSATSTGTGDAGEIIVSTAQDLSVSLLDTKFNDANTVDVTVSTANGTLTIANSLSLDLDDISLTADSILIEAQITGTGTILLQPLTKTQSIGISGGSGTFSVDDAALGRLVDGFSSITIGRADGEHLVEIDSATFRDPVRIQAPNGAGSISVIDSGVSSNGILGTNEASITLNGATTILDADIITQSRSITIGNDVVLGSSVSIDTTNRGLQTAGNGVTVTGLIEDTVGESNSLTIRGGTAGNIDLQGAIGVSENIAGLTIVNALNLSLSDVTVEANGNVNQTSGTGTTTVNGTLVTSGSGSVQLTTNRNIVLNSGTSITTVDGGVALTSNPVGNQVGGFIGVFGDNATIRTIGTGNISLTARGGNDAGTGSHIGVLLQNGTTVSSTLAGATGGTITIVGTGGTGTSNNSGVDVRDATTVVQSIGGDISIVGSGANGSGTDNQGVVVQTAAAVVSTGTADIAISGTATTGVGVELNTSGSIGGGATAAGDITLTADSIVLSGSVNVQSSGVLTIAPQTASTNLNLGTGATDTGLQLDDTELAQLADGFSSVTIGDAANGTGTVIIDTATFVDDVTIVGGAISVTGLTGNDTVDNGDGTGLRGVTLTARSGDITDGENASATDVTAALVTLNAEAGAIGEDTGSGNEALELAAVTLVTDSTNGSNNGNQFLTEADSLTWNSSSAGSGTITISSGRFNVGDGEIITTGSVLVTGGTLGGTGTVNGSVTANTGSSVAPGFSPGVLNTGNLVLNSGSTLSIEVDGDQGAGVDPNGHDQLVVSGTVDITDATLSLDVSDLMSSEVTATDEFIIIDNDSFDAVIGTFDGLAENAVVATNLGGTGLVAIIHYGGGDGNDVSLEVVGAIFEIVGNNAVYTDLAGLVNTLTLTRITDGGTDYVQISDSSTVLVAGAQAGVEQVSVNTVRIDVAQFSGDIFVNTNAANDSLTVDYSGTGGLFTKDISFDGGAPIVGAGDSLTLTGNPVAFTTVTYVFDNESDGSIDVDGRTIDYVDLEPITANISVTNVVLNYSTTAETITASDAGGGRTLIDSDVAGESLTFNNPSGTLTINAGDTGVNTVNIGTLATSYPASIDINGGDAGDTVNLTGTVTFAANNSLTVDADTINAPNAASDITTSGTGSVSLTAVQSILLSSDSSITTVDGEITLSANSAGTATGDFTGLTTDDATIQTSGTGNISLTGFGGDDAGTGTHAGVLLQNTTTVSSTLAGATAGTITINGTGGDGTLNNHGVYVVDSTVQSNGGNINLTGTPGTVSGVGNRGVYIENSTVQSTGLATLTLAGTGGDGTEDNHGVDISGATTLVTSATGNIQITGNADGSSLRNRGVLVRAGATVSSTGTATVAIDGTGGDGTDDNIGVDIRDTNSAVQSATGDITISGTGGNGSGIGNRGVLVLDGASVLSTGAANIDLTGTATAGDDVEFDTNVTIGGGPATGDIDINADSLLMQTNVNVQSAGALTIAPRTANTAINLGTGVTDAGLQIDDLELAFLTDGFSSITIGDAATGTGDITVNNSTFNDNVTIIGGPITVAGAVGVTGTTTLTAAGAVAINAGITSSGSIVVTAADTAGAGEDVDIAAAVIVQSSGGSITIDAGDDFSMAAGSVLNASTTITVNIDSGDADAGAGATADLGGTFTSGSGATVASAGDDDTFNVNATTTATLTGAAGDDTFNVSFDVGGTIDGGTNGDLLNVSGHATSQLLNLGNSSVSAVNGGGANGFLNFEDFTGDGVNDTLRGTASADTFTVATENDGTFSGGAVTADFTDFSILEGVAGADVFTFNASLTGSADGGAGNDTFTLSGGTVGGSVDGGADADLLTLDNVANTIAVTGAGSGTATGTGGFSNVEAITGNADVDAFSFTDAGSLTGAIDGAGGTSDSLTGDADGNTFVVTAVDTGTLAGKTSGWSNIENLTGGATIDTFTFNASLTGTADGGADDDTFTVNVNVAGTIDGGADGANGDLLNVSAHTTAQLFDLGDSSVSALKSGGANGFANVEDFTGDGANDTLQGTGNADTFSVNATNAGSISGGVTADFTDFATLNGAAGDDRFNFTNGGSVAVVNGNDGDDRTTVDLSSGTKPAQDIAIDGGANGETNGDDLIVIGNGIAGNDEATYTPTAAEAGTVDLNLDGAAGTDFTVTFVDLEPVDLTDMLVVTINGSANTDTIALTDGTSIGGEDAIEVSGTVDGFTMETAFVRDVGTLNILTTAGNDTITINGATNAHNVINLTLDTGVDTDSIAVAGSATVTGTMILTTTGSIADSGGGGTLSADSLKLDSGTGVGTSGDVIDTTVNTLAATASTSGGVFITETDGLTIATVDLLAGVTATAGEVFLVLTDGTLTVNQQIAATGADNDVRIDVNGAGDDDDIVLASNGNVSATDQVELRASRDITQATSTITVSGTSLAMIAGRDIGTAFGDAAIDTNVTTLAASAGNATAGNIFVRQTAAGGDLTIGEVTTGLAGTPTVTGAVANTAAGTVHVRTLDGGIVVSQVVTAAGTGNVVLDAFDTGANAAHSIDIQASITADEGAGGDVHLRADDAITRSTGAGTVSGDSVYFEAGTGVGASANVIVTSAASLGVNAGDVVFLTEADSVAISTAVTDIINAGTFEGIATSNDDVTLNLTGDGATLTIENDASGTNTVRLGTGDLFARADEMGIATGTDFAVTATVVTLRSQADQSIALGAADNAADNILELDTAELAEISATDLIIGGGGATTTSIDLTADTAIASVTNVLLQANGAIDNSGGAGVELNVNAGNGSLALDAGGNIGGTNAFGTEVATLRAATSSGSIAVEETVAGGALQLGRVTIDGADFDNTSGTGTISVTTLDGNLTTLATGGSVSTTGAGSAITLTAAGDTVNNEQNLVLNNSVTSNGGEIELNATGNIQLATADADVVSFTAATAGVIDINADSDAMDDGSLIIVDTGATLDSDSDTGGDTDADIVISAANLDIQADATIDSGTAVLRIAPSAANDVTIGSGAGATTFGISNTEINFVDEASTIVIGRLDGVTTASSITVNGDFSVAAVGGTPNLTLVTLGTIADDGTARTVTTGATLTLDSQLGITGSGGSTNNLFGVATVTLAARAETSGNVQIVEADGFTVGTEIEASSAFVGATDADASTPAAGISTATTGGHDIILETTAGDIVVDNRVAASKSGDSVVTIRSGRAIVDGGGANDDAEDVFGQTVSLTSVTGVGTGAAGSLDVAADSVEATNSTSGNVEINLLDPNGGSVTITSVDNQTAGDIVLTSTTSVAATAFTIQSLDTNAGSISVTLGTTANSLVINTTGIVADSAAGTAGTGTVTLDTTAAAAPITVSAGITSDQGAIDINSAAAFTLSNGIVIQSAGGNVTVDTTGANALLVNGDITTAGTGTIALTGSDAITMDVDSLVQTAAGAITLTSAAGGVTTDIVESTGSGQITITANGAGASISEVDDDGRIGMGADSNLLLTATNAIGGSGTATLNTSVAQVEATAGAGGVFITNTGDLTVGNVDGGTTGVSATGSNIEVTASKALTTDEAVINSGTGAVNIVLTSTDDGGNNDDLTINDRVALSNATATGDITLNAGNDLVITDSLSTDDIQNAGSGQIIANVTRDLAVGADVDFVTTGGMIDLNVGRDASFGASSSVSSAGGAIDLAVSGIVSLGTNASIDSGAATIVITGSTELSLADQASMSATDQLVTINTDEISISTTSGSEASISSGTARTIIRPETGGQAIAVELGSNPGSANVLELSAAELDQVTAGVLEIGSAATGAFTVTAAIAPANTTTLHLITGATGTSVSQSASATISETNLAITAAAAVTLNEDNDVDVLAVNVSGTGDIGFTDTDGLTVGTVDGVSGLDANSGNVSVTTGSGGGASTGLQVSQSIVADSGGAGTSTVSLSGTVADEAFILDDNTSINTHDGKITLTFDNFDIGTTGTSIHTTTANTIEIGTIDAGTRFSLGDAGANAADNVARISDAELNRIGLTAAVAELEIVTANVSANAIDMFGNVTLLDGQTPELLLNATAGGITDSGTATLTVTTLGLQAGGGGIATSGDRLLVDTGNDTIAATATGPIFITEADGATVGSVTVDGVTVTGITTTGAGGSIDLVLTNGTLTVNEQIAATGAGNDVRIDVNGAGDDDDIVLASNGNISAPDQVELRASQDITQATSTITVSATSLAMIAGRNIGTAFGDAAIDTNVTTVAALAGDNVAGNVFIRETVAGGDLTIGEVTTGLAGTPTVTGAVANTADGTVDVRTLDGGIVVSEVVTAAGSGNIVLDAFDTGADSAHTIDIQANVTADEGNFGDVHLRADDAITRSTGAGTVSGDSVFFEAGTGVGASANVIVTSAATLGVSAGSDVFLDEAAAGTDLTIGQVQDLITPGTFDGIATSTDAVTVRLLADGGTLTVTDALAADTIRTSGANVTLVADEMTFVSGNAQLGVNAGAAIVVLKSLNAEAVDLGSVATTVNDILELSAAEIAEISAAGGSIVVGSDADATNVTATSISLSTDVDFTTSNVLLTSTGDITSTAAANEVNVNSGAGALTFQAGGSIGAAGTAFGLEVATVSAVAGTTDDLIEIEDVAGDLTVGRVMIGATNFDNVSASDTVMIVASGGNLSTTATTGQISTTGDNDKITLTSATGSVTISGSVTSDGGEIEVNADTGITLNNADADVVSFMTTGAGGQGIAGLIDINADVNTDGSGTFLISDAGATLSTDSDTDANIDISGGDFSLTADATIDAGTSTLLIAPGAGKDVTLGNGAGVTNFGISNTEINFVDEASSLVIGQTNSTTTASSITIDGAFNLSTIATTPGNVTLITSGAISNAGGTLTMPAAADLLLLAQTGIGASGNAIATVGLSDIAAQSNSGGVFVTNSGSGNINITTVTDGVANTATGITSPTGGDIEVVNNFGTGTLTVSQAVTASAAGTVTLTTASGDVQVDATVTSDTGMIDVNSGAAFTLADGISVAATSGSIDISTTGVNALTVNGNVTTGGAGNVTLDGSDLIAMDGDSLVRSSAGNVTIDSANGGVTIDVVSAVGGGNIIVAAGSDGTADASDDLTLTDAVTASGGNGNISLFAGDTIFVPAVTISAAGTGDVLLSAGTDFNEGGALQNASDAGNVTLADGSTVSAQDGNITLRALGDVQISTVDANGDGDGILGDVIITADFDGVATGLSDNVGEITEVLTGEASNITADNLALRAATGIGSADDLNTTVSTVAFNNGTSGNVNLTNSAGLTVGNFDGLTSSSNVGTGTTTIVASGPITFAHNTASDGSLTAQALETATTNFDNITVNAGFTVQSTAGNVLFEAGDRINVAATATVLATSSAATITLDSGFGDTDSDGAMTLDGAITGNTTDGVVTLDLNAQRGATQAGTGTITADGLRLISSGNDGSFSLGTSTTNDVNTLAANTTGAITFRDADALTIGTVTTVGITTSNDAVAIQTGDTLTIDDAVSIGTGRFTINSANGATQISGDDITAQDLLLLGDGTFMLDSAGNDVDTLAADLEPGVISYTDADDVTVGTVGATNGISTGVIATTDGGAVTINATSGTITVDQTIDTQTGTGGGIVITGDVDLNASLAAGGGTITLNGNDIAAADIVIAADLIADGTIDLDARQDILVQATVRTTGTGSDIRLTADADGDTFGGLRVEGTGFVDSADEVTLEGSNLVVIPVTTEAVQIDVDNVAAANNQVQAGGAILIQDGAAAPATADTVINGRVAATSTSATITISAEQDVLFGADGDLVGLGGTLTVTADTRVGNNGGTITMSDGSTVDATDGLIDFDADGNISLGQLTTTNVTASAATITTTSGAILDITAAETSNITAGTTVLRAATGIGDASVDDSDIDVSVASLAATTSTGDISIFDDAALDVTTVDGLSGITITTGGAGDDILIREGNAAGSEDLTISQAISNAGAGNVTLFADGADSQNDNLNINADISAAGGDVLIVSYEDVEFNSTPTVSTSGAGTISIHAGRVFNFGAALTLGSTTADIHEADASEYTVQTAGGTVTLTATRDIKLETVDAGASGTVIVTADSDLDGTGSITDSLAAETANITGLSVALRAGNGIGSGEAADEADIDLVVTNVAAVTNTGDIHLQNTGGLTIGTVDSLAGVTITDDGNTNGGGDITIRAASPLTVSAGAPVVNNAGGNITLAAEGSDAADDLTINDAVTALGGNGNINLFAGDTISLAAITIGAAGVGMVVLSAGSDFNNAMVRDGNSNGDILMTSGAAVQSEGGDITLQAPDDVQISIVNADSVVGGAIGNIVITADFAGPDTSGGAADTYTSDNVGAISDVLTGETVNLTGNIAILTAATGIGSADDLDTDLTEVNIANSTSGNVMITELAGAGDNALEVTGVTNVTGNIDIRTEDGDLLLSGAASTTTVGTITLVAGDGDNDGNGDLAIEAGITAATGQVTLTSAGNDVTFTVAGDVTTTTGEIEVNAGATGTGVITMTDNGATDATILNAGSGLIDINGGGDVTLGSVVTTNTTVNAINIASSAGAILDGGDFAVDIIADGGTTTITAGTSIGTAGDGLNTTIDRLTATASAGDVHLDETNGLSAVAVTATGVGNDVDISSATGDIIVGAVTAPNMITLTAADGGIEELTAGEADVDSDLVATTLNLDATVGIGDDATIEITATSIAADTTSSNIDLLNQNPGAAVTASSLTTGTGTIDFVQTGNEALTVTLAQTVDGTITIQNTGDADADTLTLTTVTAGGSGDVNATTLTAGDVLVGTVTADENTVTITSAGALNDAAVDTMIDITVGTGTIDLNAVDGIGNTAALELAGTSISADTSTGAIDLDNVLATAVSVTSLTTVGSTINFDQSAGGNVSFDGIVSSGTMAIAGGNILLTATDGDLTVNAAVESRSAEARFNSTENIVVTATGSVTSAVGNVILNSDTDTATSAGGGIVVQGTVNSGGGNITLGGGADPSTTSTV
ncbi:MAG: hypothetical protein ACKVII_14085, partial [Planctomycetales bacterium]